MLIFIENTPHAYAWGSRDALPEFLGVAPTGEPQAELWLGTHPSAPASVAKASAAHQTLIDLIESDPELYGVDGRPLPFLLKVLAIGAPLSLQVHPDKQQAELGFAREEAAGVPLDARERNYGDSNHKPELLVALSEVTALCGFRPLSEVRSDLLALAATSPNSEGSAALVHAASLCEVRNEGQAREARREFLSWALGADAAAGHAVAAIVSLLRGSAPPTAGVDGGRWRSLSELVDAHPTDPGVLISLLLHHVTLQPGEAVYLGARQLHAYLGGVGVEVMAASDNVLRAGLTEKHIDVAELMRIVDLGTLDEPRFEVRTVQPGLLAYEPEVPDFRLLRARLQPPSEDMALDREGVDANFSAAFGRVADDHSESLRLEVEFPLVIVVTFGKVRVARVNAEFNEVASVARGQSLYVSAGDSIELSGCGEAFLATVGDTHLRVSQLSSGS